MSQSTSGASKDVGTELQLRPDQRPVRKPRPRLAREAYIGGRTYHVTLTTYQRAPFFEDVAITRPFEATLHDVAGALEFELLAYCFMPDHMHALLRGVAADSDLLRFVQRFKQLTSFRFKRQSGAALWLQSFYDRVLRRDDDVERLAEYIFANPGAAALPKGSTAYLLRGGTLYAGELGSDGAEASSLHDLSFVENGDSDQIEAPFPQEAADRAGAPANGGGA